jgi:surfactin synthase thioesterase subunit
MTEADLPGDGWLRRFDAALTDAPRLICFPHAGGSASYFYCLSRLLAPDIEMLAVQYPGRQDRMAEHVPESLTELADRVSAALAPLTCRRTSFFGHSMGSVLAFEVARRAASWPGGGPLALFASGYPAPSRIRGGSVHRRDDDGLLQEVRGLGGIDERWLANPDVLATILPPLRADYRLMETHSRTAERLHNVPVVAFTGDRDPHTTVADAEAWSEATSGPFTLHVLAGGHFYLDDHLPTVTQAIRTTVEDVISSSADQQDEARCRPLPS